MKSLLRSSILALVVFAGYAAFSSDNSTVLGVIGTTPTCGGNVPKGFCAK
jgi:hypothetical protein